MMHSGALLGEVEVATVDVETTGLAPEKGAEMVEIAVVKMKAGEIEDIWSSLIRIEGKMNSDAEEVHGISEEELRYAPRLEDVMSIFAHKVKGCIILAHNAPFDMGFINIALFKTIRRQLKSPVIDLLGISRYLQPYFVSHRLVDIAGVLNLPAENLHRATGDSLLTAKALTTYSDMYNLWNLPIYRLSQMSRTQPFIRGLDENIVEALNRRLVIRIAYEGKEGVIERDIMPISVKNRFFLEGFCFLRGRIRSFKLNCIKSLKPIEGIYNGEI